MALKMATSTERGGISGLAPILWTLERSCWSNEESKSECCTQDARMGKHAGLVECRVG